MAQPFRETRNAIEDIFGARTPYKHEWPTRVDERSIEEPEKWVQSACVLCSNGCGLDIGVKEGKVVGVRGRATDRVNKGRLGPKGLYGWGSINHPDRLTYPMVRKNGKLERATWDEAMDLIVSKTKEIRQQLTAHGIAFYTSGQLFLEEYYALAVIGKAGLSTLHMDGNTRLCTATAAASMRESFGSDGQPGSYTDIDYTDCILMVGHNMAATQTVLWSRILDRLAGPSPPKLIAIDPRLSDTANAATIHLAPRIGTNLALLNGIQHLLFANDWVDNGFVSKHCVGVEDLRSKVEMYNPGYVEEITAVPADLIRQAAEIIGNSPTLLSTCLQGVYQSNQATASACQVNNINLLRGCIGKPGSGLYQMNGQPTAQNNREVGCDGEYPGFRNPKNPNHMQELADIWNIEYQRVPHWSQPTHVENIFNYIANGSIEMLWVSGTNPMVSLPHLTRSREILSKKELFLVVQDIFPTETTAIADVVLPAAQWGEKRGVFTNVDRTVHISQKAVEPPGEAKPDFEIFLDFGRRMDFRCKDGSPLMPWQTEEDAFNAWKRLSAGRPCDYTGLSYEKLTGGSGIQWPCNKEHPSGKERLFADGKFFTDIEHCESYGHDLETGAPYSKAEYEGMNPGGKAILKACHYIPFEEQVNEDYPFQVATGRQVYHFHTRTKTGRSTALQQADPEPVVRINEEDARHLQITDGDEVLLTSRRGQVQMKASIGRIAKGQVFLPFHFGYWDATDARARAANELTTHNWDPVSKQPMFKSGAVRVEKCSALGGEKGTIYAREAQTSTIEKVERTKKDARTVEDSRQRQRHLGLWLGTTYESMRTLQGAYKSLVDRVIPDPEVHHGLRVIQRIHGDAIKTIEPLTKKYEAATTYGQKNSRHLRDALLPSPESEHAPFETLLTLTGVYTMISNIECHLTTLEPVTQALWDKESIEAVAKASASIQRCKKWVAHQLTVRSPQTLIVPSSKMTARDD